VFCNLVVLPVFLCTCNLCFIDDDEIQNSLSLEHTKRLNCTAATKVGKTLTSLSEGVIRSSI